MYIYFLLKIVKNFHFRFIYYMKTHKNGMNKTGNFVLMMLTMHMDGSTTIRNS